MESTKSISFGQVKQVASALSNDIRITILELLTKKEQSLHELSQQLKIPLSTVTANVKILEDVGLVHSEMRPAKRGLKKICIKSVEKLVFDLNGHERLLRENVVIQNMPIGRFRNLDVSPTCGLASATGIISFVDDPVSFYDPEASDAQIIWFHTGYLEYLFPNRIPPGVSVKNFEISLEVCAEAPGYNMDWPSDIFLEVNGVLVGTFTSPGDFGEKRGLLNPAWWDDNLTQHGQHKRWIVTSEGSYIDGVKVSEASIQELSLGNTNHIVVRIGVKEDARNAGGINLFGRKFGNYEQDIRMKIEYTE